MGGTETRAENPDEYHRDDAPGNDPDNAPVEAGWLCGFTLSQELGEPEQPGGTSE